MEANKYKMGQDWLWGLKTKWELAMAPAVCFSILVNGNGITILGWVEQTFSEMPSSFFPWYCIGILLAFTSRVKFEDHPG